MRSTEIGLSTIAYLLLPLAFCLGMYFDVLGFKMFAFGGLLLGIYVVMMVPLRWALFAVFLYIGFEGFFKVVSNYHPVVHVGSDLMVIALCVKVLLKSFFYGERDIHWPPFVTLFLIHFVWVAIIVFNPYSLGLIPSIAGAKIYISMILLYFFGYYLIEDEKDVRFFMIPFLIIGVTHTVFAIYQGLTGPESVISLHSRYAVQLAKFQDTAFRPFGLTNLPGGPAIHVYQTAPFILYFIFYYRSWLLRLSMFLYIPFATLMFVLCQVRSALVKAIFGSLLFLMGAIHTASKVSARLTQNLIVASMVIGIVLTYFLPTLLEISAESSEDNQAAIDRSLTLLDSESFLTARDGAWDRFKIYVTKVPLGAGFARVGAAAGAFKEYHQQDKVFGSKYFFTDNFWLAALVEIGLPGMLIMTLLLLMILWRGFKQYFHISKISLRVMHLAILCSLVSIFIGLYGAEGILYNPESAFFWFFSGVLMKIPDLKLPMES